MGHNDGMSEDGAAAADDLSERLAALEAENERLRIELDAEPRRPAGARWRAWVSALCIVLASVIAPVSVVTAWARVQLVDEESFVTMLAPLASDPTVQSMLIDETMDAIGARVDFTAITSAAIDGVATLDLPPAAASALTSLKQPAAAGLEGLVERGVTQVVTSSAFVDVWATATRSAHRALTTVATSDGDGLVVRTADGVGIQLGGIVERVKQTLVDQGVGVAGLIPQVDRVVILGSGDTLALVRSAYAVTGVVGYWLPFVALGLFVVGVLVARRRSTGLVGSGLGLLIGGGSLAIGIAIGSAMVGSIGTQAGIDPKGLGVIYNRLSSDMAQTAAVVAVIGAVVAALAWLCGPWRPARATQAAIGSVNSGLRKGLAERGVGTGRVGRWLYTRRAVVRGILAVLAVVWLMMLRPLTVGDVVLVVVVGALAWWVLELAQNRPDEPDARKRLSALARAQLAAAQAEAAAARAEAAAATCAEGARTG